MSSAPTSESDAPSDWITPSITISGDVLRPEALIDVGPRSMIEAGWPGWPEAEMTDTPAAFPANSEEASAAGTGRSCADSRSTVNGSFT